MPSIDRHQAAVVAVRASGDYPIAQIGTFTKNDDGVFNGAIKTLTLNVKAR